MFALFATIAPILPKEQKMAQYKVIFTKRLCNDIGHERNCVQAIIDVSLAKSASRAASAAQKRFQRTRRISDWQLAADAFEVTEMKHSVSS